MAKEKKVVTLSFEEFDKIINQLKDAFQFDEDMYSLSKKYIEKQVLFDNISTSSTFLAESIWKLLNKIFLLSDEDDLVSWWCINCEFGKKFNIGDVIENNLRKNNKFKRPDLTTTKGLYDYLIFCSEAAQRSSKD